MTINPILISLLALALMLGTALTTGAVTWGVFKAQLDRLLEEQRELRGEVKKALSLVTDIGVISQRLMVVESEVSALRSASASQSNELMRVQTELMRWNRPQTPPTGSVK